MPSSLTSSIRRLSLVLASSVLLAGCEPSAPYPCPACPSAKLENKWCDSCNVGYVAGVPIHSKFLFEWMDAHGHELDLDAVRARCLTCKAALENDGFCDACRIGWVQKLGYFSRLTYHLAKGKACDPSTLTCETCRKNSKNYGWCTSCNVGMIGNVKIPTRADFDGGVRGFELMQAAIEASKRCEACALAIMSDEACFFCKITYKDGKSVKSQIIAGASTKP